MSFTASDFENIQADLFGKLDSEAALSTVSLFAIRHEATQSKIDEAMGEGTFDTTVSGKLPGAAIEVMMPTLRDINPDVSQLICTVQVLIRVLENHQINIEQPGGTGLSAEAIAWQILAILQSFFSQGLATTWFAISGDYNQDFHPLLSYDLVVGAKAQSDILPQTASVLSKEIGPLEISLTCSTPGAAIYYTVDGSYPANTDVASYAAGSTSSLYAGPFIAPLGATVRAAAYAPGLLGSPVSRFQINS